MVFYNFGFWLSPKSSYSDVVHYLIWFRLGVFIPPGYTWCYKMLKNWMLNLNKYCNWSCCCVGCLVCICLIMGCSLVVVHVILIPFDPGGGFSVFDQACNLFFVGLKKFCCQNRNIMILATVWSINIGLYHGSVRSCRGILISHNHIWSPFTPWFWWFAW